MRDIIQKNEGKLTLLRIIGFGLMVFGTLALTICSFCSGDKVPGVVSVSFFVTMLGFSLAFPTMLEGNEGLSTMRIVVFMVTNVVCMLLLKIGWASGVTSLGQIGVDQYWVGIIAFTFGAKATQSFFESRMAVPKESEKTGMAAVAYSSADIAKLAVAQNEQFLKVKFPNIAAVSDTITDPGQPDSHVIALYLKDSNTTDMPNVLEVTMADGTKKTIDTEIIRGAGTAKIQYSQLGSSIAGADYPDYAGSVCCGVKSSISGNTFKGIVTSAHIYTRGSYDDTYNGQLNVPQQKPVLLNKVKAAKWYYKVLNFSQDLAVAELDAGQVEDGKYMKFNNEFHEVGDQDLKPQSPNVTMLSNGDKTTPAYILDYNIGLEVNYESGPVYKKNVILIGSTNDKETSTPISVAGDSGSCVYHSNSKKLIGILLGRNEKFSLVLPIQDTLKTFNLKTL